MTFTLISLSKLVVSLFFIVIASLGIGISFGKRITGNVSGKKAPLYYFTGQVFISFMFIVVSVFFAYPINLYVILVLLLPFAYRGLKYLQTIGLEVFWQKLDIYKRLVLLIITASLSINLAVSLVKPTGWDEVLYHEPVVREIAQGAVRFPMLFTSPYNIFYPPFAAFYGNFPYSSESFASVVYILSGGYPSSASVTYFINFIIFLLFIRWLLVNVFKHSSTTFLTVAALMALSHSFVLLLGTSYIDTNVAIYTFIGITTLAIYLKEKKPYYLLFSFLSIGYSLGMKYSALFSLPLFFLIILIFWLKSNKKIILIKTLLVGFLLIMVAGGFWYGKNLYIYKNPVYPLIFGHMGMSDDDYNLIRDTQLESRTNRTIDGLLNYFYTTYKYEPVLLVLFFGIPWIVLFGRVKNRSIFLIPLYFSLFTFVLNFFYGNQSSRYVLIFPITVIFSSAFLIEKNKIMGLLLLFISLYSISKYPIPKSVWDSRINSLKNLEFRENGLFNEEAVGCVKSVVNYYKEVDLNKKLMTNLWDPYAPVYYQDDKVFYTISTDDLTYVDQIKKSVNYVYINDYYRELMLQNTKMQKTIDSENRLKIEDIIKTDSTLVFNKGHCLLYKINE